MSWRLLLPPETGRKKLPQDVAAVLRAQAKGGRFKPRLFLLVRPHLIAGGLDWWRPGMVVTVELGQGAADQGRLRIAPAAAATTETAWTLRPITGSRAAKAARPAPPTSPARLVLSGLELPPAGVKPVSVALEVAAGCLFVTLPPALHTLGGPGVATAPSPGVATAPSPGVAASPSPGVAASPSPGVAPSPSPGVATSAPPASRAPYRGVAASSGLGNGVGRPGRSVVA